MVLVDCYRFVTDSVGPTAPLLIVFGVIVLGRTCEVAVARLRGEALDIVGVESSLTAAGGLASLTGLLGTVNGLFLAFREFNEAAAVTPAQIGAAVGHAVGSTLLGAGVLLIASLTSAYLLPSRATR